MKTIAFLKSHKNNEKRVAVLPEDLGDFSDLDKVYIEEGYAEAIGVPDALYEQKGAHIVTRTEALQQDILVDVKLGDADYIDQLDSPKTLFGWAHAAQSLDFTTAVLKGKHTIYAWEEMYEDGRYLFYRNREIAGEAAIMHAYTFYGSMPYDTDVAIIGNGQTARGAMRILYGLGVKSLDVYTRKQEKLFIENMSNYDVLINCVMWDISRTDRLIYREDLKKLKPGAMIIDISCDPELEIETSHPTTIDDPVYYVDGVLHYAVDNTPALFSKSVSKVLSSRIAALSDQLMRDEVDAILEKAHIINKGEVLQESISQFRETKGLPSKY